MRFAYIDSQGKEIAIPSVEALQLRIELGAIVATTMFYDASADKWAPAAEHDIIRTLQRELDEQEEGGFVAPPPPTLPLPSGVSPSSEGAPATDEEESRGPLPSTEAGPPPGTAPAGQEPAPDLPLPPARIEPVAAEEAEQASSAPAEAPSPEDPLGELGFDLHPLEEAAEPAGSAAPEGDAAPAGPEGAGSPFDFGDFGALELEAPEPEPEPEREPTASDAPAGSEAPPDDWALEPSLTEQAAGQDAGGYEDFGGAMELEQPLSEYSAEDAPAWTEPEESSAPGAPPPPRTPPGAAGHDTASESPEREAARRSPRSRPVSTPPAEPARSGIVGLIAALFLLALVGGGGWFGWSLFHGSGDPSRVTERVYEAVEIPTLPSELVPAFRQLAGEALQDMVARMGALTATGVPPEPPGDWLSGRYLASASRYPEVSQYWTALAASLQELRTEEEALFREAFEARLASEAVGPEEQGALLARATAGFRSALRDRDAVYDGLADVFTASLGLHDFLLSNEDNIDYEPATGMSRDPVLEAVPLTRQLGNDMWARVDRITAALEALDALTDRVTTERLFALTLARLSATRVH